MSSITLHPRLGINARLMFCQQCGGDYEGIAMIGLRNWKRTCNWCGTVGYGMPDTDKCRCGRASWGAKTELDDYEKIPASEPCDKCKAELENLDAIVKAGGLYWKCPLGHHGAIKANEFTEAVREQIGVPAPEPAGVEFDVDCPQCHPELYEGGAGNG